MTTKKYGDSDYVTIVNNIHNRLCDLDRSDRNLGIEPKWYNLIPLVKKVNAYSNKIDVWRLAVRVMEHELIETDKSKFYVRLNKKGRKSCNKRINIKNGKIVTNTTH